MVLLRRLLRLLRQPISQYHFRSFGITLLLATAAGCGSGGSAASTQGGTQTAPPPPVQQLAVTTYRNDNARSGINTLETTLKPSNVNVVSFGRLAVVPVEGDVYAQPLYLSGVTMSDGQNHNVVILATQHNQVYAIDADSHSVLWQRSFLDNQGLVTPVPASDVNCNAIPGEIGITGTPVIDAATGTIYVVVRTKETQSGPAVYYQRLHALSVTTGQDKLAPTTIVTPSNASGTYGEALFDPLLNMQRSALLLANNEIYVAWASHCDLGSYTGWVMSFDAASLRPVSAWTPDPSGLAGGIWMGGAGPASDSAGNIYLAVGNGWTDVMSGGSNYGDSVVRLRRNASSGALTAADYFVPFDYQTMFDDDLDLGGGGTLLLPSQSGARHPNLLIVGSKNGTLYVLDRNDLGHWSADQDGQIVQSFQPTTKPVMSTPVFWNNTLYLSAFGAPVQAFAYDATTQSIDTTPVSVSSMAIDYPGSSPSISANGTSETLLWVLEFTGANGILRAFDPSDLSHELYDSEMSSDRDHVGVGMRFTVPTVAGGQVFAGAHDELDIYGLF